MSWNGFGWYQTPGSGVPYTGATADLNLGTYDLITDTLRASTSAGLLIESANGTDIGLLGAGNTANNTWYGTQKLNGATASRAIALDALKNIVVSATTDTELGYLSGVTSAIQTQFSGKLSIKTATWPFNGPTINTTTLNGETYYMVFVAEENAVVSGFILSVVSVGGDATNLKSALYNSSGTKIASETTAVLVSSAGGIQIPWTSTFTFVKGTTYVVGVEGDTSSSTFYATNASINSTSHNRTGAATLGATVPTGTATAVRLCGTFY